MKPCHLPCLAALLSSCAVAPAMATPSSAGKCDIAVGPNVHIPTEQSANEFQIAANPRNPRNLILTGITGKGADTPIYYSLDKGQSWHLGTDDLSKIPKGGGDPIVLFDRKGIAYAFSISRIPGENFANDYFSSSRDGGKSWTRPRTAIPNIMMDHWMPAADLTRGRHGGNIYLQMLMGKHDGPAYALLFRSSDQGANWKQSEVTNTAALGMPQGHRLNTGNSFLLFGNGDLFVPFHTWKDVNDPSVENPITPIDGHYFSISRDGGANFEPARKFRRADGSDLIPGRINYPGYGVDTTNGPFRDRLYATWTDQTAPGQAALFFSFSSDRGVSWSTPRAIATTFQSDDPAYAKTPLSLPDQTDTIAVNQNGVVLVSWYQFVPDGEKFIVSSKEPWKMEFEAFKHLKHQRYAAASLDGGKTFLPPRPIASEVSLTKNSYRLGDYLNVAVGADKSFHALWMDGRTGLQQMWYANVRVLCNGRPAKAGR